MSNYSSTATSNVFINGKQAEEELDNLKKQAEQYRQQLLAIAKQSDKGVGSKEWKETSKALKETTRQIKQMQSETINVEIALKRIDKASPRELKLTLKALQRSLEGIERGSKAWDEQLEKIRKVKAEINAINDDMKPKLSVWEKLNNKINDWGTAAAGAAAAFAATIMSARQAVQAYADMQQEEANVQKYTGMTTEQVNKLNDAFKKMDTRTSREDLNKLAQEAGRLGKTSQEDVMGFVRAADQINVALDDLGEGATLTISKLTGVFGDEKIYGTEKAMLKVGSVINELSQNCAASAPYLAEFASRVGGVGAQSGMTIQQIMAFAAVLDSNNQALEASSTALSQVITRIYQDPAKYARVAGLDVQHFTKLVKEDMNAALIEMLTALGNAGKMDTLAPMFKDMGENGARAVAALSTLAGHINEVKQQQEAANVAFNEGTSVTKEFNVQNNTVQAGLDKAKKNFKEIAINLGEKLQPAMRYVISSTSAAIRMLSAFVDFVIKYKIVIIAAAAAVTAYKIATSAATIATKLHTAATVAAKVAQEGWIAVQALASAGLSLLRGRTVAANQSFRIFAATIKANPLGLLYAAVTAVAAAWEMWVFKMIKVNEQQKELNKLKVEGNKNAQEEIAKINNLVRVAKDEKQSLDARHNAVAALNKIIPNYNAQIDATTGKYRAATKELKAYIKQLIRQYEIEGARQKLKDIGKQKAEQQAIIQQEKDYRSSQKKYEGSYISDSEDFSNGASITYTTQIARSRSRENDARKKLADLEKQESAITKIYGGDMAKEDAKEPAKPSPSTTGSAGSSAKSSGGGTQSGKVGSKGNEDKFKKEKAWKDEQEALNRIAYAKGEIDYEDYTKKLDAIAVEFYKKELEHKNLSKNERIAIEAQYWEAVKKQRDEENKRTIDDESMAYNAEKAVIEQHYLDGTVSKRTYDIMLENLELAHLRVMTQITAKGSKEREDAEEQYRTRRIAAQEKRRKEQQDKEKEHQDQIKQIKDKYFGLTEQEEKEQQAVELALLNEVYERLKKQAAGNNELLKELDKSYKKALKSINSGTDSEQNLEQGNTWRSPKSAEKTGIKTLKQRLGDALGPKVFGSLWEDDPQQVDVMLTQVTAHVASAYQSITAMLDAETQRQIDIITRRYDTEISLAEGNSYKTKQLEKRKQEEINRLKRKQTQRESAIQIARALATTAEGAINGYTSAMKLPYPANVIMAPLVAAMATAAGMLQVATIRKQAVQANNGYAEGGFTRPGAKYEVAGVVHAGEWVASQSLVNNPATRPMIDALDYAQRNNTIGSLSKDAVSRTVTATQMLAGNNSLQDTLTNVAAGMAMYADTMRRLQKRLNEPFVTVNTVAGDKGIKQAQDEYTRLMNNTLPKNKRS